MGEIICRVLIHVAVVEYSVVMSTARPTSNIIHDASHVVTHNKCTQRVAILAPAVVHHIFHLRFTGEWVQCPINQTNAIGEHKFLLDPLCNYIVFILIWPEVVFGLK